MDTLVMIITYVYTARIRIPNYTQMFLQHNTYVWNELHMTDH